MADQFGPPRWPGDSRAPFAPGNLMSARSGAWSPRLVSETAEELRPYLQRVIDQATWLQPIDEMALLDFLRDMARAERLERWLVEHGDRYPSDDPKAPNELRDRDHRELNAIRNRLLVHRARLGLDPVSRRQLVDEGVRESPGLTDLREKGREIRERRALEAAQLDDPVVAEDGGGEP